MTKLEKLYNSINNLKELELPLSKELLDAADALEEQLIQTEIIPAISGNVEPILSQIKRDLVLVLEYHPGRPISVALSRKTTINQIPGTKALRPYDERTSEPQTADEPAPRILPTEPTRQVKNPTKGLRVTFPDGTTICRSTAIETFILALRRIGFEKVARLRLPHKGYNLVGHERREPEPGKIWQHECDGWYIWSNMSNSQKRDDLQKISDQLNLNLIIEKGKPQ